MSEYKGIKALYASFPVFTVKDTQIIATGLRKLYLVTDGKVTAIIDISRCIPCEYGFVHFLVFLTLLASHSQVTHYIVRLPSLHFLNSLQFSAIII